MADYRDLLRGGGDGGEGGGRRGAGRGGGGAPASRPVLRWKCGGLRRSPNTPAATHQDEHSVILRLRRLRQRAQARRQGSAQRAEALQGGQTSISASRPGAAAIDRGVALPNVTDGFTGRAPDLGAPRIRPGAAALRPAAMTASIADRGDTTCASAPCQMTDSRRSFLATLATGFFGAGAAVKVGRGNSAVSALDRGRTRTRS